MKTERFEQILDIYGATPEKWPQGERGAALTLVRESDAARELWDEALSLDRSLDRLVAPPPSPILVAQVMAAAPRRRPQRLRRLALGAAAPLAAAAAAVLWLRVAETVPPDYADVSALGIGEYVSATDILLSPLGFDIYGELPAFGCDASVLGCDDLDDGFEPYSRNDQLRRVRT